MSDYSMETKREIWHDTDGWHYEVGPDRDGIGLLEIRYFERSNRECINQMSFDKEAAALLHQAIGAWLAEQG